MTVTVVTTSTTQTKRREPLRVLNMAPAQARARHASSAAPGGTGKGGGRRTRASLDRQETEKEKREEAINVDKKRKAVIYDEDIEGFQFSRITTKKPKSGKEEGESGLPVPEEPAPQPSPRRGRPPKKKVEEKENANSDAVTEAKTERKGKRQTRGSAKSAPEPETEPQPQPQTLPDRSTRSTRKRDEGEQAPVEKKRKKGRPSKSHDEQRNGFVSPPPQQAGTSTIALPLADTPVIQRNKEMRGKKSAKGSRRSSLSMRGRRASSLIDSGASNALPHKKVDTADFYKHIASEGLPEPRRMRQLLIWCGTRAMGDKPSGSRSEDESARLAARVIQEELVKEFSNNSELSNWFAREDTSPPTVVVKKANPKNVQNQDKIKELEEQIQKLQRQRHALNALLRPPSIPSLKPPKLTPNGQAEQQAETEEQPSPPQSAQPIDSSLLDPSQQQILASVDPEASKRYQPSTEQPPEPTAIPPMPPSSISTRLSRITDRLAPTLDSLAAGVHDIELYRSMSDTVSSQILRICAERLEERDARNGLRRLAITAEGGSEQKDVPLRLRAREDLGPILGALSRVERR
ncbi:Mis12-Mtw1 protein family-domain-containing protein [Aspergillus egyptiacus]|nr:Mis12-Mtw1 protein family-domain-containing protein [Aspergillus egyptiacus]